MEEKQNKFLVPGAIVVAGCLIGWGIISSGNNNVELAENTDAVSDTGQQTEQISISVQDTDYILGNPDAQLMMIGFSDFNCGFCHRFHLTMKQIIDEYGKDGRVAWIFRPFPLGGENSGKKAEATECAARLGGDVKFWEFSDKLFELTTAENRVEIDQLPVIAKLIGLDEIEFSQCLDEGKAMESVQNNYQSGINAGVLGTPQEPGGTPHTLIITKSGEIFPIGGAQPYNVVKTIIDSLLEEQG